MRPPHRLHDRCSTSTSLRRRRRHDHAATHCCGGVSGAASGPRSRCPGLKVLMDPGLKMQLPAWLTIAAAAGQCRVKPQGLGNKWCAPWRSPSQHRNEKGLHLVHLIGPPRLSVLLGQVCGSCHHLRGACWHPRLRRRVIACSLALKNKELPMPEPHPEHHPRSLRRGTAQAAVLMTP